MDTNPDFIFLLIFVNLEKLFSLNIIYDIHIEGGTVLTNFFACIRCVQYKICAQKMLMVVVMRMVVMMPVMVLVMLLTSN